MENNKNEELQSRREFFKKAAKAALPVVGAVVLSALPIQQARATGCSYGGCYTGCYTTCSTHCGYACDGKCQGCGGCSGRCANSCSSGVYN